MPNQRDPNKKNVSAYVDPEVYDHLQQIMYERGYSNITEAVKALVMQTETEYRLKYPVPAERRQKRKTTKKRGTKDAN
jgi:predicted DNA-binding protein (UPF0278 family)